jgi:hypothetical protein
VDSSIIDLDELAIDGKSLTSLGEAGGSPWLAVRRSLTAAFGCQQWPLPGIGSLAQPLDSEVWMLLFPVGALLKLGIAMPDLPRFLEQEQGEQFWNSNCLIIKVPHGSVLWIPFGYIAAPVANLQGDKSPEYARIWTVPILLKEFADAIAPTPVMSAIFAFNKDHFTRKSDQILWQQRETAFKKFEALFA